jgi:Trypsin-like peptidase domain
MLIFLVLVKTGVTQDQSVESASVYKFVFTVKVDKNRELTGFRLQGTHGIITALHGVADGKDISASNMFTGFNDLAVSWIDADRDVALLTNKQLINGQADGLEPGNLTHVAPKDQVVAIGVPEATNLGPREDTHIGNPVLEALKNRIPADWYQNLEDRGSPALNIRILKLEAQITFGESGGPILDSKNHVLGMIDGGAAGFSWAIPVTDFRWHKEDQERERLDKLAALGPGGLFAASKIANKKDSEKFIGHWVPVTSAASQLSGGVPISPSGAIDISEDEKGNLRAKGSFLLQVRVSKNPPTPSTTLRPGYVFRMQGAVTGINPNVSYSRMRQEYRSTVEGSFESGYWSGGHWLNLNGDHSGDSWTPSGSEVVSLRTFDNLLQLHFFYKDTVVFQRAALDGRVPLVQQQLPRDNMKEIGLEFPPDRPQTARLYIDSIAVGQVSIDSESGGHMDFRAKAGKHTCKLDVTYTSPAYSVGNVTYIDESTTGFSATGPLTIDESASYSVSTSRKVWGHHKLEFIPN